MGFNDSGDIRQMVIQKPIHSPNLSVVEPRCELPFCIWPISRFERIGQVQASQELSVNGPPFNSITRAFPAEERRTLRFKPVEKSSLSRRYQQAWRSLKDGFTRQRHRLRDDTVVSSEFADEVPR
jgi:hypothetical protein